MWPSDLLEACISRLETAQILRFVGHSKIVVQERDDSEILCGPRVGLSPSESCGVFMWSDKKIKIKIRQKRYIRKDIKRVGTVLLDWNLYLGPPATQHSFYRALFSLHSFLLLSSQPCDVMSLFRNRNCRFFSGVDRRLWSLFRLKKKKKESQNTFT